MQVSAACQEVLAARGKSVGVEGRKRWVSCRIEEGLAGPQVKDWQVCRGR